MRENGKALHPEETVRFTPDTFLDDQGNPEDGAPVFIMRPIAGYRMGPLIMGASSNNHDSRQAELADQIHTALHWSIVGWENVKDLKGKELEFEARADGQPTEACLSRLNAINALQVWYEALRQNTLTPEEVGN